MLQGPVTRRLALLPQLLPHLSGALGPIRREQACCTFSAFQRWSLLDLGHLSFMSANWTQLARRHKFLKLAAILSSSLNSQ